MYSNNYTQQQTQFSGHAHHFDSSMSEVVTAVLAQLNKVRQESRKERLNRAKLADVAALTLLKKGCSQQSSPEFKHL